MTRRGYLLLLLHAHLPFVRHPEYANFLEERWLFEAITECYLPLLECLERLLEEGVPFRITLSLSPPLISMLRDPLLQHRYLVHLERLCDLVDSELRRTRTEPALYELARFYHRWLKSTRQRYQDVYRCDPIQGFRTLAQQGALELITTSATHGFLPLLRQERASVRAQLRLACDFFESHLGRAPPGIWLPECGYYDGLEDELKAAGLGYFFLDAHGLQNARPRPTHGVEIPLACRNGLAAFGRDPSCSREVWSHHDGYPGHPAYREFHRDLGFELRADQLGPLVPADGTRVPIGIKYHRVTNRQRADKALYDPRAARIQARRHAQAFVRQRIRAIGNSELRDRPPVFVAPYDAELLGHWWFEGPYWLEQVIRRITEDGTLELITASDYLARHPVLPRAMPSPSSWGEGGYSRIWLNGANAWMYPHLHRAARDMRALATDFSFAHTAGLEHRALNQAGRSLMLAQASDWPFIMRTGTHVGYAESRVKDHLSRFRYLHQALREHRLDERRIGALEQMDTIFPNMDYRVFSDSEG